MEEGICRRCEFHETGYQGQIWCTLAHNFVKDLGEFCPKEKNVEEIRTNCDWYLPPERMDDGKSCCLAHLADGRAHPCWIEEISDLLRDPDFDLKKTKA